jgi:hypothetical protein
MSLIASIMGIDFGESDQYRRMVEKPAKFEKEVIQWKKDFYENGIQRGFSPKLIETMSQLIIENSG